MAAKKPKLSVQPKDGKFAVEDETGKVLETADTEQEAEHDIEELMVEELEDQEPDPEEEAKEKAAGDDSQKLADVASGTAAIPVTEHNPHGLDIHERFARLLVTLKKRGIHHSEEAHPLQNAQTAPGNFAK